MNKYFLSVSCLCLLVLSVCSTGPASANSFAPKFKFAIGSGLQYAGLFGAQFNAASNNHKLYFSLGFGGLGGGYDYAVSNNVSVGVNYSRVFALFVTTSLASVNINYHFSSAFERGWVLGFDVGRTDSSGLLEDAFESLNFLFISAGYKF